MKGTLKFIPATHVSLEELAEAFNAAFAGYFYPQQKTAASLAQRVRHEQLALQHSLLAYEDKKFVGLALLGLRGSDGWCGGFGIVPELRGRGLASELMREFMACARGCGVKRLSLEVLARNTPARRLYERAGMQITRDLLILERAGEMTLRKNLKDLKEAAPKFLLSHFERLHREPPAWQRDLAALLVTGNMRGLYLGEMSAPSAYALFIARPDGIIHLIDLAAMDSEHANALSAGIMQLPGKLKIINEPENSLFAAALTLNGFQETDRQHEMMCEM
ncbi:MAG TPA: GNAT family N-acetyltransferase [Pyrinomonadaceae bacterium]